MKISHKLILSFLLVASVASISTFFTIKSFEEIKASFAHLIDDPTQMMEALNDLRDAGQALVASTSEYGFIHEEAASFTEDRGAEQAHDEEEKEVIETGREKFEAALHKYEVLVRTIETDEQESLQNFIASGADLMASTREMIEMKKLDRGGREILQKRQEMAVHQRVFHNYVDAALKRETDEQIETETNIEANIVFSEKRTFIVRVFTFVLAILTGFVVAFSISRRIGKLKNASQKVGDGDLDTQIDITSKDEIGELSRAFNKMIGDLKLSRSNLVAADILTKKVWDSMIDFVVVTDLDLIITKVNKATLKLNGYEESELIGKSVNMLMADRPFSQKGVDILRINGFAPELDKVNLNKDGTLTPITMSLSVLKDEQGQDLGIVCVGKDITERKRVETEREVISEIIQGVATTSNLDELLALIHQSIKKVLYAENCYVALYDAETDLLSVPFCIDKYDTVASPAKLGNGLTGHLIRKGQPMLMTAELILELTETSDVTPVGTTPAIWLGVPLRTPEGIIGVLVVQHYEDKDAYSLKDVGFLCSVGDQIALAIERKENEKALNESRELYRDLVENAIDIIYTHDVKGNYTSVNRAGERITGYTREEALKLNLADIIAPEYGEKATQMIAAKIAGDVVAPYDVEILTKDGGRVALEINTRILYENGLPVAVHGIARDITERKRSDAELQDSRRRVEDIVNSVEGIVWEADAQTFIFSFVSAQAEQILGYPSQRWIDEPTFWSEHIHPDDRDVAVNFCVDATNKMLPHEFEYRMLARDGRDVWIKDTVTVLSENGRPTMLRGIMMDITEQKRTKTALEESEASFKSLFDTASDAIFVTKEGALQACNPAAEKLFGCTREEMLARRFKADFSPLRQSDGRLSSEKAAEYSAAAMIGEPQFFEWTHKRLDGTPFDAEVNLTRVDVGGMTQIQATVRDITERKRAEQVILESEEKLRDLVENANDVIYTLDLAGNFTSLNRAGERITGYSRAEALERSLASIIAPENVARVYERFAQNKKGIPLPNFELEIIAKDGRKITMDISSRRMTQDGVPVGLQGIGRDITESLKTRNDLKIFNEKLQQSNRELQDFAYVASHDLQEPLRKVQAFSDRLRTKYADKLEGEGLDYLERMRSAANRMQMLIQDLLTFSRIATKAQPFVAVDLEEVTREVLSDLEVKIEETGATVELKDLSMIDADPMQIRQLMQNLIGNALKFQQKGVAPIISVTGQQIVSNGNGAARQLQISVKDNGIGFDEKYTDKIFAVFQRLHGRTEYEGSGVGLSICRKITERHNGNITAHSLPGDGSTFVVTLPINQAKLEIN